MRSPGGPSFVGRLLNVLALALSADAMFSGIVYAFGSDLQRSSPGYRYLADVAPVQSWGVAFLLVGVTLFMSALARPERLTQRVAHWCGAGLYAAWSAGLWATFLHSPAAGGTARTSIIAVTHLVLAAIYSSERRAR